MLMQRIVVAVNLEEDALHTLGQLRELPIPEGAEIHLVHVFEYVPNLVDLSFVLSPTEKEFAEIRLLMLEKLAGVQKRLGLGARPKVKLECLISPNARQEFLQYAEANHADLVVAASKERSGFIGLFEGSFTGFLSKYCRPNLLILRPRSEYTIG